MDSSEKELERKEAYSAIIGIIYCVAIQSITIAFQFKSIGFFKIRKIGVGE